MKQGKLRIGVCGNGTVGGGTLDILLGHAQMLERRAGCALEVTRVGARRDRDDCPTGTIPVHRDLLEVASADDVDVLVECVGGTELALDLLRTALRAGKSVVTANKALVAEHGNELFAMAEAQGVSLLCEAAVAGAIPVLKALREGMAANEVSEVAGIINGTGNFILTEMESGKREFASVLKEAQALGYAEADPSFDINGTDAAHKLAILAALAFSSKLDFASVYCEGISAITPADIDFARELGYRIKHLGIAKRTDRGLELRVHPTLLPCDSLLANVDGVLNAVQLTGHAAGSTLYSGAGAGRAATASAVVADIIDIARAKPQALNCLGVPVEMLSEQSALPIGEVSCAWYLRLLVDDAPGVMSQLASCLSAEGISIEALIQKPSREGGAMVPVVLLSNVAREEALRRAVQQISTLDAVKQPPHCIRVQSAD